MSVSDRGLERPPLRKETLAHGDEALQLPAALVPRPLSHQDEGEGGGTGRGQGHPQLVDALRERAVPDKDYIILRQAAQGLKPILQLSQSGINGTPHRHGHTTGDGSVIVVVAAGKVFGVIVHRGIRIASSTVQKGVTVNADSRDRRRAEGDALGEGGPVHKALLEGEGGNPSAGRAIGTRRAGARKGRNLRRATGRGPGISLAGSGIHLRIGQSAELLLHDATPATAPWRQRQRRQEAQEAQEAADPPGKQGDPGGPSCLPARPSTHCRT